MAALNIATISMRVALVSPVFPYPNGGLYLGIERHALELSRHLRKLGCEVTVFTTFWNGGSDGDQFEGITIHRATDLSGAIGRAAAFCDMHFFTWGRGLLQFRELLSRHDVLHALGPLSTADALTSRGLPLVTHFHHYETITRPQELLYKPFHHRLERHAYRQSTLVATPSRHSMGDLQSAFHLPAERIRIVPQGADLSRYTPRSEARSGPPVFLCVGAHEARKGLSYLWRALSLLQERGIDFRLLSVGAGPETRRLKALAKELHLDSRIAFAGYLVDPSGEELPRVYGESDLLIHPSLEEGFGMVLVEAMASGLPVVASNAGAIPEVVGDAGILVPPRDPRSLADAIEKVLSDRALGESMGRKGRARAEALFSWESVARRTIEVYKEAIELAGHAS